MEKVYVNDDGTLKFEVTGLSYLDHSSLDRIKLLNLSESILLVPDPNNKFDSQAIQVKTANDSTFIGYVNREALEYIHMILKSDTKYEASICRKTEHDIPYIWILVKFEDIELISESDENNFGEDVDYVETVYNISPDDADYFDIDDIRDEDDDAMLELNSMFLLESINSNEDIKDWYNDLKEDRMYKVKYLKKRIKARVEKEGFKFS